MLVSGEATSTPGYGENVSNINYKKLITCMLENYIVNKIKSGIPSVQ